MIKETGQKWDSVREMGDDLGIDVSHLYKKLREVRGNGGPLSLAAVWADEQESE